jgi:hypothetical protein
MGQMTASYQLFEASEVSFPGGSLPFACAVPVDTVLDTAGAVAERPPSPAAERPAFIE